MQEIKPSKDFKIITPHDADYVEKMKKLSQETDINIYKKPGTSNDKVEEENLKDKIICFACRVYMDGNWLFQDYGFR